MKNLFKILIVSFTLLISFIYPYDIKININNLVEYGGKKFPQNDDQPYTGMVFDIYKNTGKKIFEGHYKDGIKDGKWIYYNENGLIEKEVIYSVFTWKNEPWGGDWEECEEVIKIYMKKDESFPLEQVIYKKSKSCIYHYTNEPWVGDWEERIYVDGVLQGPSVYHWKGGDWEEKTYVDGVLQGPSVYHWKGGDWEERTNVDGVVQGTYFHFFINGRWEKGTYVNGKKYKD